MIRPICFQVVAALLLLASCNKAEKAPAATQDSVLPSAVDTTIPDLPPAPAPPVAKDTVSGRTEIRDREAYERLLGRHNFSLHWISWEYFGKLNAKDSAGTLTLSGEHRSRTGDDYLTLSGIVMSVDKYEFSFDGTIKTKVSHIGQGKECVRQGKMTFRITGTRRYWRLAEMESTCDTVVDYIDIFLRD